MTVAHAHDPRGPLPAILDRLDKVKPMAGGWVARCPAHDDRNPSLKIDEAADGRVLLHCHAGCTVGAICGSLNLDEADLFPPRDQPRQEVAVYRYDDEHGNHLYDVVRFHPKDFRQRRADGTWGLGDTRRVLYRLPNVRAAIERGDTVYIVEGEKDALAVERAGATATCNPMGAGKWRSEYTEQLAGAAQVVIVADNDDPGIAHAGHVAQHLEQAQIPHKITLPAAGKDVADHLHAGHSLAELVPRITSVDTEPEDSWEPINLADLDEQPPIRPTLGDVGIVYPGKRHIFSGPQESAKTLAAYAVALEVIRRGGTVVVIDFEMGRWDARNRLRDLGAQQDELARIHYVDPAEPATEQRIGRLVEIRPQLVIVDAAAGAYDIQGLDDNKRGDVEKFTRIYVRDFWRNGIATIVLDHVVKNTEARGKYAIGSERKVGGADVHLGFEVVTPISRGTQGVYKILTHKDRGGFLQRGRLADLHLASDPETHRITWQFKPAEHAPTDEPWRPTILMQRVSEYLAAQPDSVSFNQVITAVKGRDAKVKEALEHLLALGHIGQQHGERGARNVHLITPYTPPLPTSAAPLPEEVTSTSATSAPSYGGQSVAEHAPEEPTSAQAELDVHDPDVQALLDDDIPF